MDKPKKETVSVEFTPAKGGAMSETRRRVKRSGQGGGPSFDHDSERAIHPTLDHAKEHLGKALADCYKGEK